MVDLISYSCFMLIAGCVDWTRAGERKIAVMQSLNGLFDRRRLRRFAAVSIAAVALFAIDAVARTVTWTGGGDGSTWNDGANWGGTVPADGDDVRVGATTVNDISGISLKSLTFTGAGGWTLSGAAISLRAGAWGGLATEAGVTGSCTVSAPLVLEEGDVWFMPAVSRKGVTITGSISGPGRLVKTGYGNLVLKAENTYTGGTYYTNGLLYVYSPGALGTSQLNMGNSFQAGGAPYCWLYVQGYGTSVDDFVITNKIVAVGETQNSGTFEVYGNVTFLGDIEYVGQCRLRGGSTIRYLGACKKTGTGGNITIQNGGTHLFDHVVEWSPNWIYGDGGGTFQFNVAGNMYSKAMLSASTLRAGVENAFANVEHYFGGSGGGGWLDLNGHNQRITSLHDETTRFTARTHGVKSATPATLTVSGGSNNHFSGQFNGAASFVWAPTADRTFTVSNTTWSTTGAITVSAGTVKFVDGASLPGLSAATVASGAALRFDASCSLNKEVAVTLAEDAVIEVNSQTMFSSLKIGTVTLEGGLTYGGPNAASAVDVVLGQIAGAGTIVLPVVDVPAVDAVWDAGGGADTSLSTPENWEGDVVPDLSSGAVMAHFAVGSRATASGVVKFRGVSVVPEASAKSFSFDGADGSRLDFYGGGISFTGNSPGLTGSFDLALPVRTMAEQAWDFWRGACNTAAIYFTNSISSYSPLAHITFGGNSTIYLGGDNSGFMADLVQTSGTVVVRSDNALGSSASGRYVLRNPNKNAMLMFQGGTFGRELDLAGNDVRVMDFAAGTTTVFTNMLSVNLNNVRYSVNSGSRVVIAGGSTMSKLFIPSGASGLTVVTNTPGAGLNFWMDGGDSVVEFGVASNRLNGTLIASRSILRTTVPYALYSGNMSLGVAYAGGGGTLDLYGTHQRITNIDNPNPATYTSAQSNTWASVGTPRIHSDEPGVLHYANSAADVWYLRFTGKASLSYEPTSNVQLTIHEHSTSEGELVVKNGTLTFAMDGGWTNCTAVTLAGGVMRVQHGSSRTGGRYDAGTFSRRTSLYVPYGSSGRIQLDAGVSQDMEFLYLEDENGKWCKQALGVWGAPGGSAPNAAACFTGSGVVNFRGDGKGTMMTLR